MNRPLVVVLCVLCFATLARAQELFEQGTRSFQLYGSYADTFRLGDEQTKTLNAAVGWYAYDRFSINVEAVGYSFETDGDDIEAGGADLLFRWHALVVDRFSLFLDAAGGGLYAEDQFPRGGTHFNWIARLGGGFTFELWDDVHLMSGVRYVHLSNGDRHGRPRNPSMDAVETFVGVMWTF
jgi:hypothetical protein